jgi:hypothetical protein
MEFVQSKIVSLKAHPELNEKWLQERLIADPSLLGLGDLIVKGSERPQPRAGRLDLMLTDDASSTRYEVELQLGATDASHIIRTIEYWDIERSRYPQYDHVAVLVAEDVTSRFLNVISLFNKSIPLIVIQIRALDVGGSLTLSATTVLDLTRLGTDEEDYETEATDRNYWLLRSSDLSIGLVDQIMKLVQTIDPLYEPKYNKPYIGIARNGLADNFVSFLPRKNHTILEFRILRSEEIDTQLEIAEIEVLEYKNRRGRYRVRITPETLENHSDLILELIKRAHGSYSEDET